MTIFCERRRATDPKTPWDWFCFICGKGLFIFGVFSAGALVGAGFIAAKYEIREINARMEKLDDDCGSRFCKKGSNK